MPSITTLDGYTFSNWGPVTTTFTAPASCATNTNSMMIAINTTFPAWEFAAQCSTFGYYDCVPTGTAKPPLTYNDNPTLDYQEAYFSPGLYCPSGWATVGVAARHGDKSVSSSGILSLSTTASVNPDIPQWESPATLLMDLLDPGETAVMCCPSSMTAHIALGCYSTVSDYRPTTGCQRSLPASDVGEVTRTRVMDGTTVEQLVETLTATYPVTKTSTITFDAEEKSSLVGVSIMPIITLVHHQSDLQAAATGTAGSSTALSTTNAAVRLGWELNAWDGFGAVLGISVAAMALGAAIVVPW